MPAFSKGCRPSGKNPASPSSEHTGALSALVLPIGRRQCDCTTPQSRPDTAVSRAQGFYSPRRRPTTKNVSNHIAWCRRQSQNCTHPTTDRVLLRPVILSAGTPLLRAGVECPLSRSATRRATAYHLLQFVHPPYNRKFQ